MKTLLVIIATSFSSIMVNANGLLTNPTTGNPITTGLIDAIEFCSNGTDVVLALANDDTESLYLIDILDNNPADAAANTLTKIPDFIAGVESHLGKSSLTLKDIQINPISKAIYVLMTDFSSSYLVKVTNDGSNHTTVDLSNVSYSKLKFSNSNFKVKDMAWGDNQLFVSSGANFSLDSEIGAAAAPFEHNDSTTNRNTTLFKTNWGGSYYTKAPLDKWDYAEFKGNKRLIGVTTCAPGFSFETSEIAQSGLLTVEEQFNVRFSAPTKVVFVNQDTASYLFDLHPISGGNGLYRIAEKWFDDSRITANQHNANVIHLRESNGTAAASLSEEEVKMYNDTLFMISFFNNYKLAALDKHDTLKMMEVGEEPAVGIKSSIKKINFTVSPNPTSGKITLESDLLKEENVFIMIHSLKGDEIMQVKSNSQSKMNLDLSKYPASIYLISIVQNNIVVDSHTIVIK